jgi:hypothetical protein
MSKQWGHGFHTGHQEGEKWGEIVESGKWQIELSKVSSRLELIANALRFPVEDRSVRTGTWWALYVSAAAQQIQDIARELPGGLAIAIEFEKDIPRDAK